MKKERGVTLVEIIIVLGIMMMGTAVVVPRLVSSNEQSKELSVDSDRATLKTKCSVYYLNTAEHAIKASKLTNLMDKDTVKFVNWLSTELNLPLDTASTYDALDTRFGWVSCQKLIDEKLLDTIPNDDRYILDTQTYTVYHVTDAEEVWTQLFVESGSHTNSLDNMAVRRFPIETSTTYMSTVNSTCMAGNIIYVGGKGTLKLAKVEIGTSTQTVTDLTDRLTDAVEVFGVSNIGSALKVEYLDSTGKVVILDIAY